MPPRGAIILGMFIGRDRTAGGRGDSCGRAGGHRADCVEGVEKLEVVQGWEVDLAVELQLDVGQWIGRVGSLGGFMGQQGFNNELVVDGAQSLDGFTLHRCRPGRHAGQDRADGHAVHVGSIQQEGASASLCH